MSEQLYFSTNVSNDTLLCISPLTDTRAAAAGPEVESDPVGYFLYECRVSGGPDDVSVIARVLTEEAAWRLSRLLKME